MKNTVSLKNKKPRDKVVSQSMLISILSILMCLLFLCSLSFAWFTARESSGENVIKSSYFALDVEVFDQNGNDVFVQKDDNGVQTCTFANAGTYTVVLKMTDDATATKGYCQLSISTVAEKMQTKPISKDTSVGVNPFTFTIEVEANTVAVFESKWGISSSADIAHNSNLVFVEEPETPEDNA